MTEAVVLHHLKVKPRPHFPVSWLCRWPCHGSGQKRAFHRLRIRSRRRRPGGIHILTCTGQEVACADGTQLCEAHGACGVLGSSPKAKRPPPL